MSVNLNKALLGTIGKWLPLRRHPGGGIANKLRCHFTKGIVKSMGKNCIVEKGAEIMEDCVFGEETAIGPNCLIGPGTIFKGHNMMGPNVYIYTTAHKYNNKSHSFDGVTEVNPVAIGHDVWIGQGVTILPGVSIGNNVIIGAGSVVTKSIPAGVMAAGNPCVVKRVIDEEVYQNENIAH